MIHLTRDTCLDRVHNSEAAGQTAIESDAVDTKVAGGFDGVTFIAMLGEVTDGAGLTLKVQHSDEHGSGFEEIEGATVSHRTSDGDANGKMLVVEVVRHRKRYIRAVLERDGQDAAVDGIVAVMTDPSNPMTEHGDAVLASKLVLSSETTE